jgi:hypothetical protein
MTVVILVSKEKGSYYCRLFREQGAEDEWNYHV